jgi:hypothetical protein
MFLRAISNASYRRPAGSNKAPISEQAVGNVWKAGDIGGGEPVEKKIDFATLFFFHLNPG